MSKLGKYKLPTHERHVSRYTEVENKEYITIQHFNAFDSPLRPKKGENQ